jgi:hypothetical protein
MLGIVSIFRAFDMVCVHCNCILYVTLSSSVTVCCTVCATIASPVPDHVITGAVGATILVIGWI